jgi:alpha-L-fucosidase
MSVADATEMGVCDSIVEMIMKWSVCNILSLAAIASTVAVSNLKAEKMEDGWITDVRNSAEMKQAIREWQNIGFEIFVHWSAGTTFQGRYNGKEFTRDLWGEWIMKRAGIPVQEYAASLKTWNPKDFNAQEWADVMEKSGAKMVVYIAKHHDGFAQFKTKSNNYNIYDWGSFHTDVFGALCKELHKRGIKTGFYYSHGKDWRNNADPDPAKVKEYFEKVVYVQLKELNENYGHQTVCWFDLGAPSLELAQGCLKVLRKTNPSIVVSSRLGFHLGDFSTGGDAYVPPVPNAEPWETCMTFDYHWAWYPEDRKPKTPTQIIRMLAKIRARGGNLLLNIGPDARGKIPFQIKTCLEEVGAWLKLNADSIYSVRFIERGDFPWGVCTVKPGQLFLHVLKLPTLDYIFVPGIKSKVTGAYILADKNKTPLKIEQDKNGNLKVNLYAANASLIDYRDTVVVLTYEGNHCEVSKTPTLDDDLSNQFLPQLAELSGKPRVTATHTRITPVKNHRGVQEPLYFNYAYGFARKGAFAKWQFNAASTNLFYINIKYANHSTRTLKAVVAIGEREYPVDLPPTLLNPEWAWDSFKLAVSAGPVLIAAGDDQKISLRLADDSLDDTMETPLVGKFKSKLMIQSLSLYAVYPLIYDGYGGKPHTSDFDADEVAARYEASYSRHANDLKRMYYHPRARKK